MTQVSTAEIAQVVSAAPPPIFTPEAILLAIATFAIGIGIGILLYEKIIKKGR
jgi:hypothetical protein